MKDSDRTLLIGQLDQHKAHIRDVEHLLEREKRLQTVRTLISRSSLLLIPSLLLTLALTPFRPLIALGIGVFGIMFSGACLLLLWYTGRHERSREELEHRHTRYMEGVLGAGNFIQLQRIKGQNIYSVQIRRKETGELVKDLGVTNDLPVDDHIRG